VSIYSTGAEAFRDTTKWLVAFVPIASIVAAGAVIGPRLVRDAGASDSVIEWAGDNVWPLVGLAAVALGIGLVVWFGARVLSTQPKDFAQLVTTDDAKLSDAFSAGVGVPYFLDDGGFKQAIANLDVKWSAEQSITEAELARAVAATDMLRAWALHDALATSFTRFRIWFGVGVVLVFGGLVVATATLQPSAGTVDKPEAVEVTVSQSGAADLLDSTGCTAPAETEFVAVAGTWDAPVLEVVGPNCKFGARWQPDPDLIELRLRRDG
jgi:hypothetical protein